jgi:two-component system response regulator CpxR
MGRTNVLLVDDEKEFVDTLAERISLRMLNPLVAYSGEEALEVMKQITPDVIVLDLNMPGMNGAEVLSRIREAYPTINVIILTGHGDEKDRLTMEKMGAVGYLQKPVDIEILLETINQIAN